jgi:hypothetical protein
MCKPLDKCTKGKEFLAYAEQHGATIRHTGGHAIVSTPKGSCPIPISGNHNELGVGLRCKIRKIFMTLGLVALGICAFYVMIVLEMV